MKKRLDENVGAVIYEGLIADNLPPADVYSVKVKASQGILKRGTVLALSTGAAGTGEVVLLGTSAVENETLSANCVLAQDVDTGTATAVHGLAYRTGHFVRNKLIAKEGYTITKADEEALRGVGILLSAALEV